MPRYTDTHIVGYDDMVGDDGDDDGLMAAMGGYDIIGDAAPQAQAPQRRGNKVSANKLPQSFVGVPLSTIPASSTGTIIAVPIQRQIRPDRFVIDRNVALQALVYDIRVGTISLNASVNPVPGDAFAPDAVDTAIRAVVSAIPAVGIQLSIGERTGNAITNFTGGFFGPSLPG